MYSTSDKSLIKQSMSDLVDKKDYKTLNILLRHNPITNKFYTRELNEDIPQEDK